VTLGFNEYRGTPADEVPLAEQVARQYGTRHQTVWVSKQDFRSELGSLMGAMDQPSCDGVNSFFVSLAAARAGLKVALSGVGGDELFGGYASFLEIPRAAATFHSFQHCRPLGRMFRLVSAPILKRLTSPKYAGILEYGGTYSGAYLLRRGMFMPWELPEILDADLVREGWNELQTLVRLDETVQSLRSPHLKVSALEMTWYMGNQLLRDTDWASMHHSIEIRTPFVDTALLRSLAPQLLEPTPPTKQDMARTPRLALPDRVLHRPKTGFTVPVRQWLMNEDEEHPGERGLRGWVRHVYAAYHEDQEPAGPTGAALRPSPPRPRRRAAGKKKVLVFRIGQLGDTVVALPALWTVRKHFPDAELTLLCDRHPGRNFVIGADLLRDSGLFEKFEFYPVWPDGEHPATYAYEMVKLLQRLRRQHYDLLVYLMPSVRTRKQMLRDRRFFRMAGIKRFIGMTRIAELPEREPDRALCEVSHEAELLLARLAASGLPIPPAGQGSLNLKLAVKEQVEVSQWRGSLSGDAGRPRIAFGPGSKMSAKRWPAERFAEVGRLLIERYDIWPVVFGGPEDRPVAEELIRGWGRGHNAAGQLSLRGATQAMAGCRLYVGNDTGTMHLAAAAGICCVAIFSARDWPGRWHPYGPGHRILRTQIDCEGCGLVECLDRKNECLERITVGHVLAECEAALHASGTKVEKRN
jgi:ADP-heptose:LPS heptosyltransferase